MRYLVCFMCSIAVYSTSSAAPPVSTKIGAPVLAIGLSVADPCENSYYASMQMCAGQVVQQVVEVSETLPVVTVSEDTVVQSSDQLFTVRVIDYY